MLGIYFLTGHDEGADGEGRVFGSIAEAIMAFDAGQLSLRATVRIRLDGSSTPPLGYEAKEGWEPGQPFILETTLGRALFNGAMPTGYPFANYEVDKKRLGALVNDLAETQSKVQVAATLDAPGKELGFYWATRSGVTIAISDVVTPSAKAGLLKAARSA